MMHLFKGGEDTFVQGWGGCTCTRVGRMHLHKGREDALAQG